MEPNENIEIFKKETELANSILRRNRYSTVPPYKWYGPDPEPKDVEWDIDANLPLYTRDYLRLEVIGYKIKDNIYSPKDVTIIKKDYPAATLKHVRDYLKEHDPEVLDSLFYTRNDGEKEE